MQIKKRSSWHKHCTKNTKSLACAFLVIICLQSICAFANADQITEMQQAQYEKAFNYMRIGEFGTAIPLFSELGEYRNAENLCAYCEKRASLELPSDEKCITARTKFVDDFPRGNLYLCDVGYIYVPTECDENTGCCIYYSGGVGNENWLYLRGVYEYLKYFCPNAVILFHFHSFVDRPESATEHALNIVEKVAVERNITLTNIITVGSSSGALTALRAAAIIDRDWLFPARLTILLDAANEWECVNSWLPTEEDRIWLAISQTDIFLFEQAGVGMEKEPIAEMVNAGCSVYVVECQHDDHNSISSYAYHEGIFSWGVGEIDELNPEEYSCVALAREAQNDHD